MTEEENERIQRAYDRIKREQAEKNSFDKPEDQREYNRAFNRLQRSAYLYSNQRLIGLGEKYSDKPELQKMINREFQKRGIKKEIPGGLQ